MSPAANIGKALGGARVNLCGRRIRTLSTVMRFDTAVEVTASELRVELMFPADNASEAYFRELELARS
jgi:hypothetical protein